MNETFQCGDNTALVGYLYDECDPAERRAIDAHIAVCAACAAELAALQSTRLQLAAWAPPEAELGFQIVRPPASEPRPQRAFGWWSQPLPAWAQAVAACLIFGAGLWLGVARGSEPALQPGAGQAVAVVATAPVLRPGSAQAATADAASAADLAALERRLRNEMAQIRGAAPATRAGSQGTSEAQLLARVRELIDESEQRQQRELALRTTQVIRDFETQRRMDLAQIQGGFRQMEGVTGAQARDQRDMMNYLMRVSQQQGR